MAGTGVEKQLLTEPIRQLDLTNYCIVTVDTPVREAVERSLVAYTVIVAREALSIHRPFLERHAHEYDPAVLARLKRAMELTDSDEATARATVPFPAPDGPSMAMISLRMMSVRMAAV